MRQGPNVYSYCQNNSINLNDPRGTIFGAVVGVVGVAVAGVAIGGEISVLLDTLTISKAEWDAGCASVAAGNQHLQDVINSGGKIPIYDGNFGNGGLWGQTSTTMVPGSNAIDLFESRFNAQGWSTAVEEGVTKSMDGMPVGKSDDSNSTPEQRVEIAKALLDRGKAAMNFICNHGLAL